MRTEKCVELFGLVGRQIVGDDMGLLAARLMNHDICQGGHELGRGVARGSLAQHVTGLGVESGIQRQRAAPVVLESVTLGVSAALVSKSGSLEAR